MRQFWEVPAVLGDASVRNFLGTRIVSTLVAGSIQNFILADQARSKSSSFIPQSGIEMRARPFGTSRNLLRLRQPHPTQQVGVTGVWMQLVKPSIYSQKRKLILDFCSLWKDADPDIPMLKQAKAEYAKLQKGFAGWSSGVAPASARIDPYPKPS